MKSLLLLLLFLVVGCTKALPPTPKIPYVRVAKPVVKDVPLYLEYVGHVEANLSVEVKAQVAGVVTGQYFVEGQKVCKNALLMTIDPRPFQAELDKSVGILTQNLASWELARDTMERNRGLVQLNYISQLNFDQMVTNVQTAEALVRQARADVETAEIHLSYCTIVAPFDGVASKVLVDVGNYVPVGGNQPLLTVNQISPIRVSFFVSERDFLKIALLQKEGKLKTRVLRDTLWVEGELFLIDNQVKEETGMILLQAAFENRDRALWPGEFVDVQLILKIETGALLVPSEVVQIGQEGPYLYVLKKDSTVELRQVKVGQKEDGLTIVECGLGTDETVVVEGQLNLTSGIRVEVKS